MELVDLYLSIDTIFGPLPTTSLVFHLQGIPCLRRLDLYVRATLPSNASTSHPSKTEVIFPLSKTDTFSTFFGYGALLEALVAGFISPAPKDLYLVIDDETSTFPILHLSRFIYDIEHLSCG